MSYAKTAASGVTWSSASQFGRQILQLASMVLLARMLIPADFGLMNMALVVVGLLNTFKDLGTGSAIIQRQDISDELLSTLFWINIIFGCVVTLLLLALSAPIAALFQEPRLTDIIRVLSVLFVFSSLSVVSQNLLQKSMRFAVLAKIELLAAVLGIGSAVAGALLGAGVWSLVYQALIIAAVTSVFFFIAAPFKPKLVFRKESFISVLPYISNLTGYNIFNYFVRNADSFLIGTFLGAGALGIYGLAYRLIYYPMLTLSSILVRVLFPLYAAVQDDSARFRSIFVRVSVSAALLIFPLMVVLTALNEQFILFAFGQEWLPAASVLSILAPLGIIQALDQMTGTIYTATGRTDIMFRWGVFTGLIAVAAFYFGLRWGITGVAAANLGISLLWVYPSLWLSFRLIQLPIFFYLLRMGKVLLIAVIPGIALYFGYPLFENLFSVKAAFPFAMVVFGLMYAALSYLFLRSELLEIRNVFFGKTAPVEINPKVSS